MIIETEADEALKLGLPIVDVRSPSEYAQGHIPQAENIPLFTDAERSDLGKIFKHISPESAIEKGYKYVNPKLNNLTNEAIRISPEKKIIVHCWRGGMRSNSYAKHLDENGFKEVYLIKGGYKAYRNFVLDTFNSKFNITLLGGYTGSGKTYILKELQSFGEQIIDLENLANHKGSTFGGIGQMPQPTTEQFENILHHELMKINSRKRLWIEDESHNIGRNEIPHSFFLQMQNAKLVFIDIPQTARAMHLVEDYSNCDKQKLADSIIHISKRLGGLNVKNALNFLENDNFYEVALIALSYYDKYYLQFMQSRDKEKVVTLKAKEINHLKNAETIIESY